MKNLIAQLIYFLDYN